MQYVEKALTNVAKVVFSKCPLTKVVPVLKMYAIDRKDK